MSLLAATDPTSLLTLLGIAGGALGIVGVLAGAGAVVRASTVKANLELLRGEVSDLTASNARLDGENSQLHKEVEVLRELVTGRAAVDQLTQAVQSLQASLTSQHTALMQQLAGHGRSA